MISFYKDEAGVVMFKDDSYLETMLFVIERPATDEDAATHPDEHAAFVAATAPEPVPTVSPDGVA
jgi:hypothetical protein